MTSHFQQVKGLLLDQDYGSALVLLEERASAAEARGDGGEPSEGPSFFEAFTRGFCALQVGEMAKGERYLLACRDQFADDTTVDKAQKQKLHKTLSDLYLKVRT
jgi:hypothetical protein